MRTYFVFFEFYFWLVAGNMEKVFGCVRDPFRQRVVLMTPMVFMVFQLIIGLSMVSTTIIASLVVYVFLLPITLLLVMSMNNLAYTSMRREKAEKERLENEKRFRETLERIEKNHKEQEEFRKKLDDFTKAKQVSKKHTKLMDAYEILGTTPEASIETVKKKYRELSKVHHPDIIGGDGSSFIRITAAYESIIKQIN